MPAFRVLTKEEADSALANDRAEWFGAIFEGAVIEMKSRPTLSKSMHAVLNAAQSKMRTKKSENGFLVWAESTVDRDFGVDADDEPPLDPYLTQ